MPNDSNDKGSPTEDHVHPTGALRSEIAPFYTAIPPDSLRRVALRATGAPRGEKPRVEDNREYDGGSLKYGYGNWAKGLIMEDTINHIMEHFRSWRRGIESGQVPRQDDLAAIAWGILMPLMTFEYQYAEQFAFRAFLRSRGMTDPTMIDEALSKKFNGKVLIQPLSPAAPVSNRNQIPSTMDGQCGAMVAGSNQIRRCDKTRGHDGPHVQGPVSWGHPEHETAPAALKRTARLSDIHKEPVLTVPVDGPPLFRECDCVKQLRDNTIPVGWTELAPVSLLGHTIRKIADVCCEKCFGGGVVEVSR